MKKLSTQILVVGAGPAGLSSAITACELGAKVLVCDENPEPGGQLIKQTHKFFGAEQHYCGIRGITIRKILYEKAKEKGAEILLNTSCVGLYEEKVALLVQDEESFEVKFDCVIVSTGARENMLLFDGNDLPGIYGAGALQTLMNVYGVLPGKKMLMIGSGNIGLIVSYQAVQAGIEVVGIVEALPHIGGYLVHAQKVRRLGIPIYTCHTIKEAIGKEHVEGAIIWRLENWKPIEGTEKEIECDIICLAAGLSPSIELLEQAGCKIVYVPELGGRVPWHDEFMETSQKGIFVAGDASGIEEAVTAILEGRIAGAAAVNRINPTVKAVKIIKETQKDIEEFRKGPFGEKPRKGKQKLFSYYP